MSFLDFDDTGSKPSSFLLPTNASASSPSSTSPAELNTPSRSAHGANVRDAAEEEALLEEFMKNPKAAMALAESYMNASQAPRQPMTEMTPVPGFVLQTQTIKESNNVPMGDQKSAVLPKETVVYINVCSSDLMPKPSIATEAEIQKAINAEEGATYQVPFQLSPPREYKDPVSKSYLVVDTCIHTDAFKRTLSDFDYKLYIMELAMEWVEEKCRVELSRNFQLPEMRCKDELKKRSVILPKPPAIQEVGDSSTSTAAKTFLKKPLVVAQDALAQTKTKTNAKGKDGRAILVPVAGEDDIVPMSRLLPCAKGTMGIIVEIDLPNHKNMNDVSLDVVLPDKLVLHSKSQGQDVDHGKSYHAEIDLPNEPVDLDTLHAEFSIAKRVMRVYTLKKKRR